MIAYSVLVPDCDTVDYFIGIDSYTNGQIQAKYLVKKLGLKDTKQSFNLEIFHQSGNGSALYAFLGAMDVLKPYLDNSTLVIPSGDTTEEECGVADADGAADRLSHLLETTYADGKPLDAILCTDDTISVGVAQGLADSYSGEHPAADGRPAGHHLGGGHRQHGSAGGKDGRSGHERQDCRPVRGKSLRCARLPLRARQGDLEKL